MTPSCYTVLSQARGALAGEYRVFYEPDSRAFRYVVRRWDGSYWRFESLTMFKFFAIRQAKHFNAGRGENEKIREIWRQV